MKDDGYIALVGADAAADTLAALRHASELQSLLLVEVPGNIAVLAGRRCAVLTLPNRAGIILGTLFDRSGRRLQEVAPHIAESWIATSGESLLASHWGAYLAVLATATGPLIVRDPSGLFPCYRTRSRNAWLFASDTAWAGLPGGFKPEICWAEIHAQLQYFSRRTARTALEGVEELLPGTAFRLEQGAASTLALWNPYRFAQDWDPAMRFEDATDKLGRAATHAIGAWARIYPRALVEMSGGLDSSIVAASSAAQTRHLHAITFRGSAADLDETRYAEAVASHLDIPWHCAPLSVDDVDLHASAAADLPSPTVRCFSQAPDKQSLAFGGSVGCDAFFIGTGGDNVLWYFNTAAPALDRLALEGVGGFLATVGDLARMCGVPWLTALRISLRKRMQRRPRPWPHSSALLSKAASAPATVPAHPWWPPPPGTLPGVRAYVRCLIQMYDHHDYHLRAAHAPVIAPLVSQPIVEACLGIPSWLSCTTGNNRAVARAAFARQLPDTILGRRTKGGFDGFVQDLMEHNRGVAREMLLEGQLAREGWLDMDAIARCFARPGQIPPDSARRLLRLVAIEAWLDSARARGFG